MISLVKRLSLGRVGFDDFLRHAYRSRSMRRHLLEFGLVLLSLWCALVTWPARAAGFNYVASMSQARQGHTATALTNGKVLIVGGDAGGASLGSVELYDPASDTWTGVGDLDTGRSGHTATELSNGNVLIVGGYFGDVNLGPVTPSSNAALFDPSTNSLTVITGPTVARFHHSATRLLSGQVLVAGGVAGNQATTKTVEIFDPSTNGWSTVAPLSTARRYSTAVTLQSGKALVVGGLNQGEASVLSAELYDPANNSWVAAGTVAVPRRYHSLTLLASGQVLAAGGYTGGEYTASVELYTPASNSWSAASTLSTARYMHTSTLLNNGLILTSAGLGEAAILNSSELYGVFNNTWTAGPALNTPRYLHTATLLPSGKVLVVGGSGYGTFHSTAELYDEGNGGQLSLAIPASGPELRLAPPPTPAGSIALALFATCTRDGQPPIVASGSGMTKVSLPVGTIDFDKAYRCYTQTHYDNAPPSPPSNLVEVAIDCDRDGVPDDWERHGILGNDGARIPIPSRRVDANGNPVSDSVGNTVSCNSPENEKIAARDVWLWIDSMAGLTPSQYLSGESALIRIARSFQRQGITLRWWFGPNRIPAAPGVNLATGNDISTAASAHKAVNLFIDPVNGTFDPVQTAGRDRTFRYFVWGNQYIPSSCLPRTCDGVYSTSSGYSFGALGWNYNFIAGARAVQNLDGHTGTLMHELGHALGLGHGGPWYASDADARSRLCWVEQGGLYRSGENRKPNHVSVMNYQYQFKGLLHFDGRYKFDYNAYAFDDVNENSLNGFWLRPLTVGGVQNLAYGVRLRCRPAGTLAALAPSLSETEWPVGSPASCSTFSTESGNFAVPYRPVTADMNWDPDNDPAVPAHVVLRVKPDWSNLRFELAFMGDPQAIGAKTCANSAGASLELDEAPAAQLDTPHDYKHQLEVFDDPQALSLAPGQTGNISIRLRNRGFVDDSYVIVAGNSSGWQQSMYSLSLPVARGRDETFVVSVTAPPMGTVGETTTLSVRAVSAASPLAEDAREFAISVAAPGAANPPGATPPSTAYAQALLFDEQANVKLDSYVESNPVFLNGLTLPTEIQVRRAEYSINGGSWQSTRGEVQPNDILRLRVISESFPSSLVVGEVLVGGQYGEFRATTRPCSLDVDGNGTIEAATDGLLILRYLLGFRGNALVTAATGQPAPGRQLAARSTAADMEPFLQNMLQNQSLDVDSDLRASPFTDGLLILRAMLGAPLSPVAIGAAMGADPLIHLRTKCDLP